MSDFIAISLITVCRNAAATIDRCIQSVLKQDYKHIEYIIIDGASEDGTVDIINRYADEIALFISEPDNGLYDAMNKGIALARGHVIGILNADDFFIDNTVITNVAQAFRQSGADVVYGDLNFVNRLNKITRRWVAGKYKAGAFNWGWMPPHPTFYAKKELFTKYGAYNLNYGNAADYELMLRLIHVHKASVFYLRMTFLHMLTGGVSNKSISQRVKNYEFDLKAMKHNHIRLPLISLLLKPLRKISQYTV